MDNFKQFFVKYETQNCLSAGTFAFMETTKFLFALQVWQFAYILLQNVLNSTLLFHLDNVLTPNPQWERL